jgi:hypothetical protein
MMVTEIKTTESSESIQCRSQNKTPGVGGRLLFNKIKNQKNARDIIAYK